MSTDEQDAPSEDTQLEQESEPVPQEAYPALELTQLSESEHDGGDGWQSLDDE